MRRVWERFPRLTLRNWALLAIVFFEFCARYTERFDGIWTVLALLALGFGTLFHTWASGRIRFDRFTVSLTAACAVMLLSTFLNRKLSTGALTEMLCRDVYMLLPIAIPLGANARDLRREKISVAALFVILMFPQALLGVASVFIGRPIQLPFADNAIGIQTAGMLHDRIRLLEDINHSAMSVCIAVFLAIYLLHQRIPKLARALLAVAIFTFVLALAHGQSRTSICVFAVGMGAVAFHFLRLRLRGKRWSLPASLAAWVAASALSIALLLALFSVDVRIAYRLGASGGSAAETTSRFIADNATLLDGNGRGSIWGIAIRYFLAHPFHLIFGMGSGNIMNHIFPPSDNPVPHLHNSFLQLVARGGLLSLACVLVAMVLLVRPCARLLSRREVGGDRGAYVFAVCVGVFLVMSLPEAPIFVMTSARNLFFFLSAGYVMHMHREGLLEPAQ